MYSTHEVSKSNSEKLFNCPQAWDTLDVVPFSNNRYCQICEKQVFLVRDDVEFLSATNSDKCVAIYSKKSDLISHVGFIPKPIN